MRVVHGVDKGLDVETAIALELTLTGACGTEFQPAFIDAECDGLPQCPVCFPAQRLNRREDARPNFVYRCYDADGRLIYVGCSVTPATRVRGHEKTAWWGEQIAHTRFTVWPSRRVALDKEALAIAFEHPRWNVKGRWPYRQGWHQEHYRDYLTAVRRAGKTLGPYSMKHIAEIEAELAQMEEAA